METILKYSAFKKWLSFLCYGIMGILFPVLIVRSIFRFGYPDWSISSWIVLVLITLAMSIFLIDAYRSARSALKLIPPITVDNLGIRGDRIIGYIPWSDIDYAWVENTKTGPTLNIKMTDRHLAKTFWLKHSRLARMLPAVIRNDEIWIDIYGYNEDEVEAAIETHGGMQKTLSGVLAENAV